MKVTVKLIIIFILVAVGLVFIFKTQMNNTKGNQNNVENNVGVVPVTHASFILSWDELNIYVDPSMYKISKTDAFAGKPIPDAILFTDIHNDHFDVEILKTIAKEKTIIIAPQAVMEKIPEEMRANTLVMKNWEVMEKLGLKIEAIPMYNLPESAESYHPKGRGNGYVLEKSGARVYISGDTAGIPEMRNLKNIDMAFVAMNLPYTMGVEEAADAVLAFKPKQVYPYHYRTPEGFSNVAEFKELVNRGNPDIEVVQLEWYPK